MMKKILLVEDEAIIAMATLKDLRSSGYEAFAVHDGEAAVKTALADPEIDLILMDIDLGSGIDGTEAARRILAGRHLPIVFLTSHGEREMVERVRNITRYGYVMKNSGHFVLQTSLEMAFELFNANRMLEDHAQQVAESDRRLRQALDAASGALLEWHVDSDEMAFSRSWSDILGYSQEELSAGKPFWEQLIHREDFPRLEAAVNEVQHDPDGNGYETELRMRHKDGHWVWILGRGKVSVRGEEGKALFFSSVNQDITTRKQREAEILYEKSFSEKLLDSLPVIFYLYDKDLRLRRWNRLHVEELGYSDEELEGFNIEDWHRDEDARKAAIGGIQYVFEHGGFRDIEALLYSKDGRGIPYRLSAVRFDTESGPMMMGIGVNISQRWEAEEARKRSEKSYSDIFNSAGDALFIHELETGRILDVNDTMLRMYGLESRDGIDGISADDLSAADEGYNSRKASDKIKAAETEGPQSFKWHARRLTGEKFWAEVRLKKITVDGKERILASVRDISKRNEAEEKVLELLDEKELILKEVHHRIKNNMETVKSIIGLQLPEVEDPGARSVLEDTQSRIQSVMTLYNLLDQSGNFLSTDGDAYLNELINDISALFPRSLDVRVERSIEPFRASSKRLFSLGIIVNELFTNILKYAFNQGSRNNVIRVSTAVHGDELLLEIHDNGAGLPEGFILKEQKGFGLKLVDILVDQLGGSLSIHSDGGAWFSFQIPLSGR
jgi:PAS domain S-box-containing protein